MDIREIMAEVRKLDNDIKRDQQLINQLQNIVDKNISRREQLRSEFRVGINKPLGARHPDIYTE